MPLCQVNIVEGKIQNPRVTAQSLSAACHRLTPGAPAIVLIHGYKHSPSRATHDPHTHILSLEPRRTWKAVSWPRLLGLGGEGGPDPLCLALGWEARGTLWHAYTRAAATGAALAEVVRLVKQTSPATPVQVLAHSLGGRVALAALPHLPAGGIDRMVLLAAAELRSRAEAWLDCPAGRTAEVLNVTSRENALFDLLIEWLLAPHRLGDRALGAGLGRMAPRWLDLWMDEPETRATLARMGYDIPAPDKRVCHWSVYLRSGLFDLYRAVLTEGLSLAEMRAALPERAPRKPLRSALLPNLPLPMPRRGAS